MNLPELTPMTLGASALALAFFVAAALVPGINAAAAIGAGTTLLAAAWVKRSGDVKSPKEPKE